MAFQVSVTHWFLLTPFCHRQRWCREGEGRAVRGKWELEAAEKGELGGPGTCARRAEWDQSRAEGDSRDSGSRTVLKGRSSSEQ